MQAKVEPASLDSKLKLASVAVVEAGGWLPIEVSGAVVSGGGSTAGGASTVQEPEAGVASTLPAASLARTEKAWEPRPRPEKLTGELHAPQLAPSSLQAKVEPDSLEEKEKLARLDVVLAGGRVPIEVSGAVVSAGACTVQGLTTGIAVVSQTRRLLTIRHPEGMRWEFNAT